MIDTTVVYKRLRVAAVRKGHSGVGGGYTKDKLDLFLWSDVA